MPATEISLPPIARGYRWPEADQTIRVTYADGSNVPESWAADDWTLRLSRSRRAGDPDLALPLAAAWSAEDSLTLTLSATSEQTAALPEVGHRGYDLQADLVHELDGEPVLRATARVRVVHKAGEAA